jgi:hypothetical protein
MKSPAAIKSPTMISLPRFVSVSRPEAVPRRRLSNPYATRWVRPGATPYFFPQDSHATSVETAQLLEKLRASGWRGAIVGPHGSGKSTLLATVVPAIEQSGIPVQLLALHDGQRRLPPVVLRDIRQHVEDMQAPCRQICEYPRGLMIVDGYEQLGWWARRRLSALCRRCGWGLLITAHSNLSAGDIPLLFHTVANLATVQYLVDYILPPHGGVIFPDDVAAAFTAHAGNVRETLFALYDLFEQRRLPEVQAAR